MAVDACSSSECYSLPCVFERRAAQPYQGASRLSEVDNHKNKELSVPLESISQARAADWRRAGRCLDVTVAMKRGLSGECGGEGPILLTFTPLLRLMFHRLKRGIGL
ncbi:hypothetical protein CPT32_04720 [Rhizobium sophoriradicis]|nr:hypothetical protein CPT32_04720 [Rhizobium sophoriradicis]